MRRRASVISFTVAIVATMAIVTSPTAANPEYVAVTSSLRGSGSAATQQEPQFGPSQARVQAERSTSAFEQPPSVVRESTGFDWGDALVGAGTVTLLTLISLSVMFVLRHRGRTANVASIPQSSNPQRSGS